MFPRRRLWILSIHVGLITCIFASGNVPTNRIGDFRRMDVNGGDADHGDVASRSLFAADNLFTPRTGAVKQSKKSKKSEDAKNSKKSRKEKDKKKSSYDDDDDDSKSSRSAQRTCNTDKERDCFRSCKLQRRCGDNDKDCLQKCKNKCCKYSSGDGSKDKKKKKKSDIFSKKRTRDYDRWCDTQTEKRCRNKCFDAHHCKDNDEDCKKRCRYSCCKGKKRKKMKKRKKKKKKSDEHKGDRKQSQMSDGDDDDDSKSSRSAQRTCNTDKERDCFRSCKQKRTCDENDKKCLQMCKAECGCIRESGSTTDEGGSGGGGGDDDKETKTDKDSQDKDSGGDGGSGGSGAGEDGGDGSNGGSGASSDGGDGGNNGGDGDGGNSDVTKKSFTGNLPVEFRFTINTRLRLTAQDIMSGDGNTVKDDIEGGLKLLIAEVVQEIFRTKRRSLQRLLRPPLDFEPVSLGREGLRNMKQNHRDEQQIGRQEHRHRRWLLVEFDGDESPPKVKDVYDVGCPINVPQGGCRRVVAEVTLKLTEEEEDSVRRGFVQAIAEAIGAKRLEEKILEYNPNHGKRTTEEGGVTTLSTGDVDEGLTAIQIAGISVGAVVGVFLLFFAVSEAVRRRKRRKERANDPDTSPDGHNKREIVGSGGDVQDPLRSGVGGGYASSAARSTASSDMHRDSPNVRRSKRPQAATSAVEKVGPGPEATPEVVPRVTSAAAAAASGDTSLHHSSSGPSMRELAASSFSPDTAKVAGAGAIVGAAAVAGVYDDGGSETPSEHSSEDYRDKIQSLHDSSSFDQAGNVGGDGAEIQPRRSSDDYGNRIHEIDDYGYEDSSLQHDVSAGDDGSETPSQRSLGDYGDHSHEMIEESGYEDARLENEVSANEVSANEVATGADVDVDSYSYPYSSGPRGSPDYSDPDIAMYSSPESQQSLDQDTEPSLPASEDEAPIAVRTDDEESASSSGWDSHHSYSDKVEASQELHGDEDKDEGGNAYTEDVNPTDEALASKAQGAETGADASPSEEERGSPSARSRNEITSQAAGDEPGDRDYRKSTVMDLVKMFDSPSPAK